MNATPALFSVLPALPGAQQLAISVDTLVDNVHFTADTPVDALGFKCVTVNLSDMAAMGATPFALHCAWSDPSGDSAWREALQAAIKSTAEAVPMSADLAMVEAPRRQICIQIMGKVPAGGALTRAGARVGDQLWVSGTLGDAGAALALLQNSLHVTNSDDRAYLLQRLYRPTARLQLGRALHGIASAAIDISDGIVGDAAHLLARSKVGLRIFAHRLPLSAALLRVAGASRAQQLALAAGEDYELAFSAPAHRAAQVAQAGNSCGVPVQCIGEVIAGNALQLLDEQMRCLPLPSAFDHFADRNTQQQPANDAPGDGKNSEATTR